MKFILLPVIILFLFTTILFTADDAARGHFQSAQSFLQQNRFDEALADFERVSRVYPDSEWADDAVAGIGTIYRKRGNPNRAYDQFAQVLAKFPGSSGAAQAQYEMGIVVLYGASNQGGDFRQSVIEAAIHFQKVIDRYPDSPFAIQAKEMNTLLYRLHLSSTDKRIYAIDNSFSPFIPDLDEPLGMAIDSKQNLYLGDKGKKFVYTFDSKGKQIDTMVAASPYNISVADNDQVLIANFSNVLVKNSESFTLRSSASATLNEIRSIAMSSAGLYFVVSEQVKGIQVYNDRKEPVLSPSMPKLGEYYKVAVNSADQILALDKDRKLLSVFSSGGKTLFTIQPGLKGLDYGRIEDFTTDRANHIYLLTHNPKGIVVLTPTNEMKKFIASEKKGLSPSFEEGKLIAVGASGSIYIVDKESKRILKLG